METEQVFIKTEEEREVVMQETTCLEAER